MDGSRDSGLTTVKKLSADNPAPSSPTSQRPEAARSSGYFEATRSNDALELIQLNPLAFTLAYIIAARANWHHGFNRHNLGFGEAFLGDYKECGMSERNYRTAKEQLAKWNFATFKPTNKGTIARLTDTRLFKINPPKDDGQNANVRRTADGQPTTNLNLKAGKQESSKAYSTKANKLSGRQKELADRMEAALGDQWVNDAGKWIGRIKEHFGTSGRHAYDYYTLLRWVACGVAAFTAFQAAQNKKFGWLFIFIIAAIVLNPISPLHLKRGTWAFVDAAAAVLLLLSIAVMDVRKPRS